MNRIIIFFLFLFFESQIWAQSGINFYRSSANSLYWANRKPYTGYWQQDVYYKINASINENTDILDGYEELTYYNNSPNDLEYVYFHLYQNAYQPGSYFDNLYLTNGNKPDYGHYESQGLGIQIEQITINNVDVKTELDNTILKVFLPQSLKSGESITFKIKFKTFFDIEASWRRLRVYNAYGFKHYNGSQWYPRICVYDIKSGWNTDQHLGHEFYGDFGVFDVELNFANNFIVEATGVLQNEEEVLPASLKAKLDITKFKDKPLGEKPSIIIPYDSTIRKTWKYYAENVHDVAFVADPTFRIGEVIYTPNGENENAIKCISLAMEPNASRWQNAAEFTAKIVKYYSETFGTFHYPKMIVADAESGMEYPMLTMDSELDPDYKYLLAHEIGHNWFFGMVGSNETYRAAMDEGFTVFISSLAIDSLSKTEAIESPNPSKYVTNFEKKYSFTEKIIYETYYRHALETDGVQLNTHSDAFNTNEAYGNTYRQVYYKTAVMLNNLQYVLGDTLFFAAMKNYFNQWKFAHPTIEDMRASFIAYTKTDLNWFFDQWLETNKTIDYSIKSVKPGNKKDQYIVTFKRKGRMQMPIDFSVINKKDSIYHFHIPNNWFIKKTDATVLPKWFGWDNLNKTYQATIQVKEGISNVIIDPSGKLADLNMINNSYRLPLSMRFDPKIEMSPDRKKYEFMACPNIWWNSYDGIKLGFQLGGSYFNYKHIFDLKVWGNTGVFQNETLAKPNFNFYDAISYSIDYFTPLPSFSKNTAILLNAIDLDGVHSYKAEFEKKNQKQNIRYYIQFHSQYIHTYDDRKYLLYPDEWGISEELGKTKYNNSITFGFDNSYKIRLGTGYNYFKIRTSALNSSYNFTTINFTNIHQKNIYKLNLNTRIFLQYSKGSTIADESSLFFAGGNPEDLLNNKLTRTVGWINKEWVGYGLNTNHFQHSGGLNLRGYAGYLMAEQDKEGNVIYAYKGHSGIALNTEIAFDNYLLNRRQKIFEFIDVSTYIFGDAGILSINKISAPLSFSSLRVDAGIGTTLTIKKWWVLDKFKPLTFRLDLPFFLNRPPYEEDHYFKFRWVVGVSRRL